MVVDCFSILLFQLDDLKEIGLSAKQVLLVNFHIIHLSS